MDGFKRIIVWALLSIMLQASVLLYLDKVYFKESSDFNMEEGNQKPTTFLQDLSIPKEATKIECSFSGKYVSYYIGNKLYLLDTRTGKSEEIITNDGKREVLYSVWYPNTSDSLIIAEKKVSSFSKKLIVNPIRFDAKDKSERNVITTDSQQKQEILYTSGTQVNSIETSLANGVTYVGVSKSGSNAILNRTNMNSEFKSFNSQVPTIGEIKIFPKNGDMIYEDKKNYRIYSLINGKISKVNLPSNGKYVLLGVSDPDVVYVGELTGDKISKIVYGSFNGKSWNNIPLDKGVSSKDIFINTKNEVLVNDSLSGKVKNLTTKEEVSYEGTFVSVNNKVILSTSSGKVFVKNLADATNKSSK